MPPADPPPNTETADIVVVGAGAAGLFAAIHAARTDPSLRIIAVDGAKTLGAKILVAGGGRCNVTHHAVSERDYHGSSRNAIRNVLRRFTVDQTVELFSTLGVQLKREDTGKLFPVTDSARTVLSALLDAVHESGTEIRHPWRVDSIIQAEDSFNVTSITGATITTKRVILAAGGKSLPKSGSDGAGERLARSLGLPITPRVFPALVPLTLPGDHWLCSLSGLAVDARIYVRSASGKTLAEATGAVLCTHFGLSGPAVLDISRSYLDAKQDDPAATLALSVITDQQPDELDRKLTDLAKQTPLVFLKSHAVPERLALALCKLVHVNPNTIELRRDERRELVAALTALDLPVIDARGWNYAEVTAGGVPLSSLILKTMESRDCPELHLCGEVCDVDGRIGGFNFQWAWSSGYVAGISAAKALAAKSV